MPFESKSQNRLFRAKEAKGELPKGTSDRWAKHTKKPIKDLPEKKAFPAASEAEIDIFVKAAMDRYAELGFPEPIAKELFKAQMTKIAGDLGFPLPGDTRETVIVKRAVATLVDKGMPRKQAEAVILNLNLQAAAIEKRARVKAKITNLIKNANKKV